jgi:hypothetical protein
LSVARLSQVAAKACAAANTKVHSKKRRLEFKVVSAP